MRFHVGVPRIPSTGVRHLLKAADYGSSGEGRQVGLGSLRNQGTGARKQLVEISRCLNLTSRLQQTKRCGAVWGAMFPRLDQPRLRLIAHRTDGQHNVKLQLPPLRHKRHVRATPPASLSSS